MSSTDEAPRKRILILTFTQFNREPRALKQLGVLNDDHEVWTAGYGPAPEASTAHIELDPSPTHRGVMAIPGVHTALVALRLYPILARVLPRNRAAARQLANTEWDLVIAHDVATVPVASRLKSRYGLMVDLHEYAPRQGEESRRWRLVSQGYFTWIVRRLVTKARAVSTVSQGIVDEYRNQFGLECSLVVNASPYHDIAVRPVGSPLRLVHSGGPSVARKIEVMIEAVRDTTADVTLDFYLLDDGSPYMEALRTLASGVDRISFNDPVPYAQLVDTLADYDLGISLLAPVNFNHVWALPNKFFDYIQARLGVIIGPSPEMERIVREYGVGAVAEDFTAAGLAKLLESIDRSQVHAWKAGSARYARELSSETQVLVWKAMVHSLFAAGQP